MGVPLHFTAPSSTAIMEYSCESKLSLPPIHLTHSCILDLEAGSESFSKYSELFPEEAEPV
jgi:hypothetical protein